MARHGRRRVSPAGPPRVASNFDMRKQGGILPERPCSSAATRTVCGSSAHDAGRTFARIDHSGQLNAPFGPTQRARPVEIDHEKARAPPGHLRHRALELVTGSRATDIRAHLWRGEQLDDRRTVPGLGLTEHEALGPDRGRRPSDGSQVCHARRLTEGQTTERARGASCRWDRWLSGPELSVGWLRLRLRHALWFGGWPGGRVTARRGAGTVTPGRA